MRFATQEPCSCFRLQIFTKQEAKENVSLHKNKAGGRDLWKCCCAVESGEDCLYFLFDNFIRFFRCFFFADTKLRILRNEIKTG